MTEKQLNRLYRKLSPSGKYLMMQLEDEEVEAIVNDLGEAKAVLELNQRGEAENMKTLSLLKSLGGVNSTGNVDPMVMMDVEMEIAKQRKH